MLCRQLPTKQAGSAAKNIKLCFTGYGEEGSMAFNSDHTLVAIMRKQHQTCMCLHTFTTDIVNKAVSPVIACDSASMQVVFDSLTYRKSLFS